MMTEQEAWETLRAVMDPEAGLNIVDLGLVREVRVDGNRIWVCMTLTSPSCPVGESLLAGVQAVLELREPGAEVRVELAWDPPWTPAEIRPEAKSALGW